MNRGTSVTPARVWITGSGGLIGSTLMGMASSSVPGWHIYGTTRHDGNLADAATVHTIFRTLQPDVIIHCAGMTQSAACERDPAQARALNVEMTARLIELADTGWKVRIVFISTDLVFDGRTGHYDETAAVNPLSVYGQTKAQAERIVLTNPAHTVIRTSLNGGTSPTGDRGFNEELRLAWRAGHSVNLFTDEFRCPIPAYVTARAVWALVEQNHTGLYHVAGTERLSRWEIGRLLAQRWPHLNPTLAPVSRLTYTGPPRPADTSLNCTKVQQLLPFTLPGLTEWLQSNPNEIF